MPQSATSTGQGSGTAPALRKAKSVKSVKYEMPARPGSAVDGGLAADSSWRDTLQEVEEIKARTMFRCRLQPPRTTAVAMIMMRPHYVRPTELVLSLP